MQVNKVESQEAKSIPFSQVLSGQVFRAAHVTFKNAALFMKTQNSQRVRLSDGHLLFCDDSDTCVLVDAVVNATGDKV